MNLKVYKSSKPERTTVIKGNLKGSNLNSNIAEPQNSNLPDQPNSLIEKNNSLKYFLYWNEAYENKYIII